MSMIMAVVMTFVVMIFVVTVLLGTLLAICMRVVVAMMRIMTYLL